MPSESIGVEPAAIVPGRVEAIASLHAAVEGEFEGLLRQVAVFIHKLPGRRTREEVDDLAGEALGEAVRRVLENPGNFDPARSAFAWIVGVAVRVAGERSRGSGPRSRRVELVLEAWHAIEDPLGRGDESGMFDRLELAGVLTLLDPSDRQALQCFYIRGLADEALAEALGTATVSAARSRVYRALKKARDLASPRQGEVKP